MTLYRAARNSYQRLFNREHWSHRQAQRALFRDFVVPGSLVFDIGASKGEMSDAFLALGARVLAVEPNPLLAEELARHFGPVLTVENAAVGATAGQAQLHLGRDPGHSTLSGDWLERAPTADRWQGETVADRSDHARPADREARRSPLREDRRRGVRGRGPLGAELDGAGTPFEYQAAYLEVAERCLDLLGDEYEYSLTKYEEPVLKTGWLDRASVLAELRGLRGDAYGDAFARRRSSAGPPV